MRLEFRAAIIGLAGAALLGAGAARAGDDGAAPIWEGIYSIVGPIAGFDKDEKAPIDYHEHGKIVVPKSMDLPEPAAAASGESWPVNQEILRKRVKAKEKDAIAPGAPAKIRATQGFPNAPVTVRAADQPDGVVGSDQSAQSTVLGNLNPLGWVGMGKSNTPLGPEPDREWLTDPPKGYRSPSVVPPQTPAKTGQAAN
jgi:hypothetical protein